VQRHPTELTADDTSVFVCEKMPRIGNVSMDGDRAFDFVADGLASSLQVLMTEHRLKL
jgi:hypothetical protein